MVVWMAVSTVWQKVVQMVGLKAGVKAVHSVDLRVGGTVVLKVLRSAVSMVVMTVELKVDGMAASTVGPKAAC